MKKNINDDVPVLCEPGTTYMPRETIERYGKETLRAITGNNMIKELTMTFEELLKKKIEVDGKEIQPEFRVAVQSERKDGIHFIIHPMNYNGDTLDFVVSGNDLKPAFG